MTRSSRRNAQQEALAIGLKETRDHLHSWRQTPTSTLPWLAAAAIVAVTMLLGALIVAYVWAPADRPFVPVFADRSSGWAEIWWLLQRNGLVLLLHLLVCFACYLARRSVPLQARHTQGVNRWVHEKASPFALLCVTACTAFSLGWQTWLLGYDLADAARALDMSAPALLSRLAPHAMIELTAVFMPLAACCLLGRRRQWNALAAAAVMCAVVALPMLLLGAAVEVWVAPRLL